MSRSAHLVRTALGLGGLLSLSIYALPAGAAGAPQLQVKQVVATGYVGPLQFALGNGHVFVTDSFDGLFTDSKSSFPLGHAPGPRGDVAGVAYDDATHTVAYAKSDHTHNLTQLFILEPGAKPIKVDLSAYEASANPDGTTEYGTDSTDPCVVSTLTKMHAPVSYTGIVDSHPYAVASLGDGAWAVADAGGNDILKVTDAGVVSTLAVMPPAAVTFTAASAAASGLPSCFAGVTYKFEGVPTDVEVNKGTLYVTDLPGGVEGPANPGSVYTLPEAGGTPQLFATGFAGATNLAVTPGGTVFVADLYDGTISEVVHGSPVTVESLPGVVALEYYHGSLFASTAPPLIGSSDPGQILRLGRSTAS